MNSLFDKTVSHAASLGIFRSVNQHQPKGAPGTGLRYVVWVQSIEPIALASGLDATSGYVVLEGWILGNALEKPEDGLDPRILTAATTLLGAYTGDFNFGATVRNIDLLGMYGRKLEAQAGRVTIGSVTYRVMTVTIPIVVNDMWVQVP